MPSTPRAVVLLSGGLDSTTTLAVATAQGFETYALTFDYGQRHLVEVKSAQRVARHFGVRDHRIVNIGELRAFGGSALTSDIPVPQDRPSDMMASEIPVTYVPARNTIFLSYALAWAEVLESRDIFIGVNALDYSGYPDCRPEYIQAYQHMAELATKAGVEGRKFTINAPLQQLGKAQIIAYGRKLGVDYSLTSSCYAPSEDGAACGHCDSCRLRMDGFAANGMTDPIRYVTRA